MMANMLYMNSLLPVFRSTSLPIWVLVIVVVGFSACRTDLSSESAIVDEDPYAHIEDEKARLIIQSAIEYAGGLDTWQQMRRLQYTKNFSLLLASGETEKRYEQVHDYTMEPYLIDIQSLENGQMIHTRLADGVYSRTQDGEPVDVSQEALEKGMNTSTYVIGIPFKLIDPGAEITYEGELTLDDGRLVDVIRFSYDAKAHDNHSSSDTWKFYFDKENREVVANFIITPDHYSLVENLTTERVGGILFNKERKSYRVDSAGNKLYLRASYVYDNYEVQ